MNRKLLIALLATITLSATSQTKYSIDASAATDPLKNVNFKMGNIGAKGYEVVLNSQYLSIGDKPVIPVMGEMHLTRVPRNYWEETLLKMKAAGVNVIAFYVFWNHHEEIEGQFNWSENYDVRAFVELCGKHGLYAYPRIGPWAHGEARNGGFPDWLLRKNQLVERSNTPVYQNYVKRFYHEIGQQLQGLYYKDGGPIIGIQLENEYWHAKQGEAHIMWLKETAKAEGMDVPLYTVTGWKSGSVPPFEVVPLFGAYPDAPWASHIKKEINEENFCFDAFRDNEKIGDETDKSKQYMDYSQYPYFTCEMGIGIQNTYHRRLIIDPKDGLAMVTAKLGSGSNLIGYYVFAGGSNPQGILHAQTEDQDETGYWNHNPDKSYDFQAAILETGETSRAYREVKKLHYFLSDFGQELAPATPVIATKRPNDIQLAVRRNGNSGFLFGINYCRYIPREPRKNVQFEVKLPTETLIFPKKGINIPDSTVFIWPFNLQLDNIQLNYATAQPLCKLDDAYVFHANGGVKPEFCVDALNVTDITIDKKSISVKNGKFIFTVDQPGMETSIVIKKTDGKATRIIVLNEAEARNAWVFNVKNRKELYISEADLYLNGGKLNIISKTATINFYKYGNPTNFRLNGQVISSKAEGVFTLYSIIQPKTIFEIKAEPKPILADAVWLQSNSEAKLSGKLQLFHRFITKEFSLENTSRIRSAIMYLAPETDCRLNINNRWVAQPIKSNTINAIDITGYAQTGENKLYLDFPLTEGVKGYAAKVVVEYYNTQRVEFVTDQSWLTKDAYNYPSELKSLGDFGVTKQMIAAPAIFQNMDIDQWKEWNIHIPYGALKNAHQVYLSLSYTGDVGQLYLGHQLVGDNFNANVPWRVALNRLDFSAEGQNLKLLITPAHYTRMFQDSPTPVSEIGKAMLKELKVESDNQVELER
ncbi:MAG: beta-galactosidase [Paludibacter sp.]|nr:beta-galactosidase [Paludibacter sp.]